MAFSQSLGKAQTPTLCQFCEDSPEIKYKCINCDLKLCDPCCSKIHHKSKASKEHEILSLNNMKPENVATAVRKVNLENLACTKHCDQKCFVFCKDCNQPACLKCLTQIHRIHDYKAINDVYDEIMKEMKDLMNKFENELKEFRKDKDNLIKLKSDGEQNFKEAREIILQTEKQMIVVISRYSKELLQDLDNKRTQSETAISTELLAMDMYENELETRKKNLKKELLSHKVSDIFSTSKHLDKSIQKYSVPKIKSNKVKFIPSNTIEKIRRDSGFGVLFTVPEMELIDSYQSDNKSVTNIVISNINFAFIGSSHSQKLQKVKFENHCIKVEKELQINMYNMTPTPDGEIILSFKESDLKLYTKDGQMKTYKSFSPLKTLGVHVTNDNKIIVGLVESFILPTTKDSVRKIVVTNQDGDKEHTIEYDRDNKKMLTFPSRINICNDKIIVVDIKNNAQEGRIAMFDFEGNPHWTYNGIKCINSDQLKFYPKDLAVTTSTHKILVSDSVNHSIHVLSNAGEVIVCKNVKSHGIHFPWSLCIDKSDVLWIGCSVQESDKISKAKISCVKLT